MRDGISLEIEADRHGQVHTLARQFPRRRREGLRAAQECQRFLVERAPPDECTTRLSITRPCLSRLKKTWAIPCSRRD
jgi:hypothetical protein